MRVGGTVGRVVAMAVALSTMPGTAGASRVEIVDQALFVSATTAERNVIDIAAVGFGWEVEDSAAPLSPGPGCIALSTHLARCDGLALRVSVQAGPRDDMVALWNVTLPATLHGGSGRDLLEGGPETDEIDGGPGADSLWGADGSDRIEGDTGDDLLRGGDGQDRLASAAGSDILEGGAGDDVLLGGDDRDLLDGEAGDDRLDGEAGRDALLVSSGTDRRTVSDEDSVYGGGRGRDRRCSETFGAQAGSCGGRTSAAPSERWPPRAASDERASASRASARTETRLRSRRQPRGVTVHVHTLGSYRSTVVLTWYDRRRRRLGRTRPLEVRTDHLYTLRVPRPPRGTVGVRGRCLCET